MALVGGNYGKSWINSNSSDFDKFLNDFGNQLNSLSQNAVSDPQFKKALQNGADILKTSLQSNYLTADPTGMGGKVSINVNIFPTRKTTKSRFYYIIGPDYKTSKGWQVWHLLNYGFVHALGKVTLSKTGKVTTRTKAGGTTTVVKGKYFLQNTMSRSGQRALEAVEFDVINYLKKNLSKYLSV